MVDVKHLPEENCFILRNGASQAILEYQHLKDNGIDFLRTYVPPEIRGKGVAERLVRKGLDWAKEQGYTITASCWYVDKFLR